MKIARMSLELRQYRWWATSLMITVTGCAACVLPVSLARADPAANARQAMISLRGATSCAPMRSDPAVEQAAEITTRLDDDYVSHIARQEPVEHPIQGLKDLGYRGSKATLLQGTAKNDADAIKAMLLEGQAVVTDCSYTDFGVSFRRNTTTGYTFTASILAGA